jgi:hypothetical protein
MNHYGNPILISNNIPTSFRLASLSYSTNLSRAAAHPAPPPPRTLHTPPLNPTPPPPAPQSIAPKPPRPLRSPAPQQHTPHPPRNTTPIATTGRLPNTSTGLSDDTFGIVRHGYGHVPSWRGNGPISSILESQAARRSGRRFAQRWKRCDRMRARA